MKTNTRQKQKIRLGEYFQGEKYDHPAWKNNECHAKSSSEGSRSSLSLKIAKKADPSLDLLLIHHVKEESHFCFGQTAGEWRYQNTNSKDCEVNFAYPKMIDSKKVLTDLGVLDYNQVMVMLGKACEVYKSVFYYHPKKSKVSLLYIDTK